MKFAKDRIMKTMRTVMVLLYAICISCTDVEEGILLAAGNQLIEVNRDGEVLDIIKFPDQDGIYDAWRLPDGGVVYVHRLGLVLLDAENNILMEHKAVKGREGAEINSVEVLDGGEKFAVMESGINKILIIDRNDKVLNSIALPDLTKEHPHFRYRMIRKVNGEDAFWVAQKRRKTLVKVNYNSGRIHKEIYLDSYLKPSAQKDQCSAVVQAPDGSLYTTTSDGRRIVHIGKDGKLISRWTSEDLGISTRQFEGMQLLENGNIMVTCSDFHLKSADENKDLLAEITPKGKVVWRLSREEIIDQIVGYVQPTAQIEETRITNVHVYDKLKIEDCLNVNR